MPGKMHSLGQREVSEDVDGVQRSLCHLLGLSSDPDILLMPAVN